VPRHRPVAGLGGAFGDHHLRGDVSPGRLAGAGPRHAQRASGAQASHQFALESSAALDVESLVDRLVTDAHRLIMGEVTRKPPSDLLGTPALHPASVTAVWLAAALPGCLLGADDSAVRCPHQARQAFLHVVA
jgi:hypothetical protein